MPDSASGPPRGRRLLLIGGGLAIGVVLLLIVANLDRGETAAGKRRIQAPTDVVAPAPLSEAERASRPGIDQGSLVQLERGAWVQVTDESGRLSQQYTADRVEPLPDRMMQLEQPRAIFFQKDGRVVTLAADAGRARVPNKALETGTLDGHVAIRVYRPEADRAVDPQADTPVLTVDAEDATFDNILGEIRCDGPIKLRSNAGTFEGEGMSLLVEPKSGVLDRLVIDRCTKPIEIVRGPESAAPKPTTVPSPPSPSAPPPPPATGETPPVPSVPAEERFYRLTLEDDVVVVRRQHGRESTLRGDKLVAIFSMEGRGALEALAWGRAPRSGCASPLAAIVGAALAQQTSGPAASERRGDGSTEVILIDYKGRLVLEPAADDERLASRDDVSVALIAGAGAGEAVTIDDDETKAHVTCRRASFRAGDDLIEAFGTDAEPLLVVSPRLRASGQRFWLRRGVGEGGFSGPGEVALASGGEAFRAMAAEFDHMLASRDASGAILVSAMALDPTPAAVTITWQDRLDLHFVPAAAAGATNARDGDLRGADFVGSVLARGEGFALDAERLEAAFGSGPSDKQELRKLVAKGNDQEVAKARRTTEEGSIEAAVLDLRLVTDADGATAPSRLEATGAVAARDPGQSLFTDALVVAFAPKAEGKEVAKRGRGLEADIDIAQVESDGDVQALLRAADGPSTRVYAQRLQGDGTARTLTVSGDDVWVVRDTVLADRMRSIGFNEASRSAESTGPGRVRAFATPFAVSDDRPLARPDASAAPTLLAEWNDGFRFDESAGDGGAIDVRGAVRVRSTPDRRSTDALDAATLRIELAPGSGKDPDAGPASVGSKAFAGQLGASGIRRVIAEGRAVAESRSWTSESRDGDPRLFHLEGERIRYDLVSREGDVEGAGRLLTHVPEQANDAGAEAKRRAAGSTEAPPVGSETIGGSPFGLGTEGTTRFGWKERLEMRSQGGDRFLVTMRKDVELVHAGRRTDDTLTLTGATLEAIVERSTADRDAGAVDLGGTAKILGIAARGDDAQRVFVRTPNMDLECDAFAYSADSQIATLTAREGRVITVVTRERPQPIRAEKVTWDMATGRITIEGARGSVSK